MGEKLKILLAHKSKFFLAIVSTIVFLLILFPYNDLSDFVSAQVAKLTNNNVFVQFSQLTPSIFPKVGLEMENLLLETRTTPAIKADKIVVTPSVWGLIQQKPAGSISAQGFLDGQIKISLSPGKRSEEGNERQAIIVEAEKLNISELRELANLPFNLKGNVSLVSDSLVDLTFTTQPDVTLELKIERFELPPSNVETMMGPLTLPELKLTNVNLRGRLSAGRFVIEEGKIGAGQDELSGEIKGNIAISLRNGPAGVTPILGAYTFDVSLTVKPNFEERSKLFLSFIESYKTPNPAGSRYAFKVQATSLNSQPNISAMR